METDTWFVVRRYREEETCTATRLNLPERARESTKMSLQAHLLAEDSVSGHQSTGNAATCVPHAHRVISEHRPRNAKATEAYLVLGEVSSHLCDKKFVLSRTHFSFHSCTRANQV